MKLQVAVALLLLSAGPSVMGGFDSGKSAAIATYVTFSADDFDWREVVPYLLTASTLPSEQGLKAVLENSAVLRAYLANEIRTECDGSPCAAMANPSAQDQEVSKRIDKIVQEGLLHSHNTTVVDYTLTRRPFPFSEIAVQKSDKHSDAYFFLSLADHTYTASDLQAKYGAPYDTDIVQWYSVFKYKVEDPRYTSKAWFEVDPTDGAVIKVAISLKLRKPKKN